MWNMWNTENIPNHFEATLYKLSKILIQLKNVNHSILLLHMHTIYVYIMLIFSSQLKSPLAKPY